MAKRLPKSKEWKKSDSSTNRTREFQPVALSEKEKEITCDVHGYIKALIKDKQYGYLAFKDEPDAIFHYKNVRNVTTNVITLKEHLKVNVSLENNPDMPGKLRAVLVLLKTKDCIKLSSDAKRKVEVQSKKGNQKTLKHRGNVISLKYDKVFIAGDHGADVLMYRDKISSYAIELQLGDSIQYELSEKDPSKPFAISAKVIQYQPRQSDDILSYLKSLIKSLESLKRNQVISEILCIKAIWICVTEPEGSHQSDCYLCILETMRVMNMIMSDCIHNHIVIAFPIEVILKSKDLANIECTEDEIIIDIAIKFCINVFMVLPGFALKILPLIQKLVSSQDLEEQNKTLLDILTSAMIKLGSRADTMLPTDRHWKHVPMIITPLELISNDLCFADESLRPIKVDIPYKCEDEYMETLYRLTRADTYSGIQEGIRNWVKGYREGIDVYTNISCIGIAIDNRSISLLLKFEPPKHIKDWKKVRNLMYGNLICISVNGKFDDALWATISNREEKLLKEQIISVKLCHDANKHTTSQIILQLQQNQGYAVMVESPNFFLPMSAIMKELKKMDISKYILCDQIVKAEHDLDNPFEDTPVAKSMPIVDKMDKAQREAFNYALTNQLAIIQGPPGTGKTFLGIAIVQALLNSIETLCHKFMKQSFLDSEDESDSEQESISSESSEANEKRPILVLTYKNHALDEFLKGLIDNKVCKTSDVIRIGGRSEEPILAECNLRNVAKEANTRTKHHYRGYPSREEIEVLQKSTRQNSYKVFKKSQLTIYCFLTCLTEKQLCLMLLNANWGRHGTLCYRVNTKTYASRQWISTKLIPLIKQRLVSLQNFVKLCKPEWKLPLFGDQEVNHLANHCYNLFTLVINHWKPDRSILEAINKMQHQIGISCKEDEIKDGIVTVQQIIAMYNEDEEEEINELQMQRRSAAGDSSKKKPPFIIDFRAPPASEGTLFESKDFPTSIEPDVELLNVEDLWRLDHISRCKLLHAILCQGKKGHQEMFDEDIQDLENAFVEKMLFQTTRDAEVAKQRPVIGATISGASINKTLIEMINPSIIIVEEAAEISEPALLASLSKNVERLIMIGDHYQLRPQVDSYQLVKDYNFDVSMMERLINCGYPYKQLKKQNRMRPEFAGLLRDIYPDLENNDDVICKNGRNVPLESITKTMFWWQHDYEEDKIIKDDKNINSTFKSKVNKKEAEMVVALAFYFLQTGTPLKNITILAAYLGQKRCIQALVREVKVDFPHIFHSNEDILKTQTIDMYQGDENDVIIISLVRSNKKKMIGFLNTLNRRCVAQSRAKCGMYFIGNIETMTSLNNTGISTWEPLINGMMASDCVGYKLKIKCQDHYEPSSMREIQNADALWYFIKNPLQLCNSLCRRFFPCALPAHKCTRPCQPMHSHDLCRSIVKFRCRECFNDNQKECHEDEERFQCMHQIPFKFADCKFGHSGQRFCYQRRDPIPSCPVPCKELMTCGIHKCRSKCGVQHNHQGCQGRVTFKFSTCQHQQMKICSQSESDLQCMATVTVELACNHKNKKKCYVKSDDVKCNHPCREKMNCKQSHKCQEKCGSAHNHDYCKHGVDYVFPECGHPSEKKKLCSQPVKWKCQKKISVVRLECFHNVTKRCSEEMCDVVCKEVCRKLRDCGHPCTNVCSDNCDKGDCILCKEAEKKKLQFLKKQVKLQIKQIESRKKRETNYGKTELDSKTDKSEYQKVKSHIFNFIKAEHNWHPKVTKIEKIQNLELEKRFENAKLSLHKDYIDFKFHGTDNPGIEGITKNGFRLSGKKDLMFGDGIYFATDSSKSSQEIYTKGSNKLLLCEILFGKQLIAEQANHNLCKKVLENWGFDSVFAPAGTQVRNDEYVIYNPDQAFPRYVIHYTVDINPSLQIPQFFPANKRTVLKQSRTISDDPLHLHYYIAEGIFARNQKNCTAKEIESISLLSNEKLKTKYAAKREQFSKEHIPADEIYAFHGTDPKNVDSILENNLDANRPSVHGRIHGHGFYLSEYPDKSLQYGKNLIVFKVLQGRVGDGPGCHCKTVTPSGEGYSKELILNDADQILPMYLYTFKP